MRKKVTLTFGCLCVIGLFLVSAMTPAAAISVSSTNEVETGADAGSTFEDIIEISVEENEDDNINDHVDSTESDILTNPDDPGGEAPTPIDGYPDLYVDEFQDYFSLDENKKSRYKCLLPI